MTTPNKKTCFAVCPIGESGSAERKRSDTVMKHVFGKALEPLGYEVVRADQIAEPGMISLQIIQKLIEADLVIADMSNHNANVFYELAVRHAFGKPVVHVIECGQKIPFDVSDFRTVQLTMDFDGVDSAIKEIQAHVKQIEEGSVGQTPIKVAATVQQLGRTPMDQLVRKLVTDLGGSINAVRADIKKLEEKFATPTISSFADISTGASFYGDPLPTVPGVPANLSVYVDPDELLRKARKLYESQCVRIEGLMKEIFRNGRVKFVPGQEVLGLMRFSVEAPLGMVLLKDSGDLLVAALAVLPDEELRKVLRRMVMSKKSTTGKT